MSPSDSVEFVKQCDSILRRWELDEFRPGQVESMGFIVDGVDSVSVMPTGGGKSLCWQGPAGELLGVTCVVTPLIAIMRDQVAALTARGIPAVCLHSGMTRREQDDAVRRLHGKSGDARLLYLSPERLGAPETIVQLAPLVGRIIVDEAHCILQWGHDFRPAYLQLGALRAVYHCPVHAFTATATVDDMNQIAAALRMPDGWRSFRGSHDRPNLFLEAHCLPGAEERDTWLFDVVSLLLQMGQKGIVYVATRADASTIAHSLHQRINLPVHPYHAGMHDELRRNVERCFSLDDRGVVVATIAFGMGVDVPDVRWIVHLGIPSSLEQYHQEIGRAGRDGNPSRCIMLWAADDLYRWYDLLDTSTDDERYQERLYSLSEMARFVNKSDCRRNTLLHYFNDPAAPYGRPCHECDRCSPDRCLL